MTDLATLQIRVDASGAIRAVDQFGKTVQGATRSTGALETRTRVLSTAVGALGGIIAAQGVARLGQLATEAVRTADTMRLLEGRLKLVTTGAANLAQVQEQLRASAIRVRASYGDTVQLFSRFALATEELGVAQQDVIRFTELLNMAVKTSGATSAEASAALFQLSQGLAAGALRGQELNSVMEQIPAVSRALAQGLGVSIAELRRMGAEGELTGDAVINAVLRMDREIRGDFANAPLTVADGWQQLKDAISQTVGEIDRATGASSFFARSLQGIASGISSAISLPNRFAQGLGTFVGGGTGGAPATGPQGPRSAAPITITASPLAARATATAAAIDNLDTILRKLEKTATAADPQLAKADRALKQLFDAMEQQAAELAQKLEDGTIAALKGQGGNSEVGRVFTEQLQTALGRFGTDLVTNGLTSLPRFWQSFVQLGRDAIGQVFARAVMERIGGKRLDGLLSSASGALGASGLGIVGITAGVVGAALNRVFGDSKWERAVENFNKAAKSQQEAAAGLAASYNASRERLVGDFLNYAGTETPAQREIRNLTTTRNDLARSALDLLGQSGALFSRGQFEGMMRNGDYDILASLARRDAESFSTQTAAGRQALLDFAEQMDRLQDAFRRNTAAAEEAAEIERKLSLERRAASLSAFRDSLGLSGQSPLSPTQQLTEARRQYDAILALARGGDQSALDSIPDVARTLLDASRAVYASGFRYAEQFNQVRSDLDALIAAARLAGTAGPMEGESVPGFGLSPNLPPNVIDVSDTILEKTALLASQQVTALASIDTALGRSATVMETIGATQVRTLQAGFTSVVDELQMVRAELATLRLALRVGLGEVREVVA